MSSADRVKYYYVPEVTPNVVPNSAAFKPLRLTSESLKRNIQSDQSKELRDDRTEPEQIIIGADVSGNLNHELLFDAHQDLLAYVTGNAAWTTVGPKVTSLKNGVATPFLSVLKQFADLSAVNHMFSGLVVNSWNLTIQKKSILSGVFALMGMSHANGAIATLATGTPTFAAPSTTDPINGSSHITAIKMSGAAITSAVDGASLQITNNYRPKEQLGSLNPTDYTQGRIQVTGTLDLYFKTETEYNLYKNGTAFPLEFEFTDNDGNKLDFLFDRCKFEDMEVVAGGTNTDIIAKGKWRALYDPTNARVFLITATTP